MKLLKKLLALVVVLILLMLGAAFLLLEPAVVAVVEKGGTYALGVDTRLAEAKVGLFSGHFGLAGLQIDNPPGFEGAHFLDLRETSVDVDLASLATDRIEIPRVLVSGVTLVLERNAHGANYDVLLAHLESLSSSEDPAPSDSEPADESEDPQEEESDAPGKNLVIHEIVLRDIRAEVSMLVINDERRTIPLVLPEITIRNLGGEEGAKVDVVYSKLIEELLAAVVTAGRDQLPAEFLSDLEGGLKEYGRAKLDEEKDQLRGKLEQSVGTEDAQAIEDAAKGFEDLWKKKD